MVEGPSVLSTAIAFSALRHVAGVSVPPRRDIDGEPGWIVDQWVCPCAHLLCTLGPHESGIQPGGSAAFYAALATVP
jgi:hypothetical protein